MEGKITKWLYKAEDFNEDLIGKFIAWSNSFTTDIPKLITKVDKDYLYYRMAPGQCGFCLFNGNDKTVTICERCKQEGYLNKELKMKVPAQGEIHSGVGYLEDGKKSWIVLESSSYG